MLSMSDMSIDDLTSKFQGIGARWIAMYAGNDISPVVPIFKAVKMSLRPASCEETLEDVVGAFRSAIRNEMTVKAEALVLSKLDMNMSEFRREGLASLGNELFTRLAYDIEQINLDLVFLVFGFEGKIQPAGHIFTINGTGEVSYFDISRFWAIGSGQTSALGTLFGIRDGVPYLGLSDVLYLVAKAKFSAESAVGVGRETSAIVLRSNGKRFLVHSGGMAKLKAIWEATRGPDVPTGANEAASELLTAGKEQLTGKAAV
jgi:hypothetical protein